MVATHWRGCHPTPLQTTKLTGEVHLERKGTASTDIKPCVSPSGAETNAGSFGRPGVCAPRWSCWSAPNPRTRSRREGRAGQPHRNTQAVSVPIPPGPAASRNGSADWAETKTHFDKEGGRRQQGSGQGGRQAGPQNGHKMDKNSPCTGVCVCVCVLMRFGEKMCANVYQNHNIRSSPQLDGHLWPFWILGRLKPLFFYRFWPFGRSQAQNPNNLMAMVSSICCRFSERDPSPGRNRASQQNFPNLEYFPASTVLFFS